MAAWVGLGVLLQESVQEAYLSSPYKWPRILFCGIFEAIPNPKQQLNNPKTSQNYQKATNLLGFLRPTPPYLRGSPYFRDIKATGGRVRALEDHATAPADGGSSTAQRSRPFEGPDGEPADGESVLNGASLRGVLPVFL